MSEPKEDFNSASLVRLWVHESYRVVGDRLIDDSDRQWFFEYMQTVCQSKFGCGFYDTFKNLDKEEKKELNLNDMRNLMFGD